MAIPSPNPVCEAKFCEFYRERILENRAIPCLRTAVLSHHPLPNLFVRKSENAYLLFSDGSGTVGTTRPLSQLINFTRRQYTKCTVGTPSLSEET